MKYILKFKILLLLNLFSLATAFASLDHELLLVENALKNNLGNKIDKIEIEYDYANNQIDNKTFPSFVRITRVVQKHGAFAGRIYYTDNSAREISGKYRAFSEIPMAKRTIKKGEVLSESDLSKKLIDITKNSNSILTELEHIIGLEAKKDIQPGCALKMHDLNKPNLIKEKDSVTLLYKTENIEIKATGQALKSACLGETIKVKNDRSQKIVTGIVIDKGIVQVNRNDNEKKN